MIRAVIFDVDGVLLDNSDVIAKGYQETARRLGIRVPGKKEIFDLCGLPRNNMILKLLGKGKGYTETYISVYKEYEKEMKIRDGADNALREITLPKAIVTSKSRNRLNRQLKGLLPYFMVVITEDDTERHKPDPEPLLLACRKLQLKPDDVAYVGDSLKDLRSAKSAGSHFIAILSGVASKKDFAEAGCNKIVNSFSELNLLLKNL